MEFQAVGVIGMLVIALVAWVTTYLVTAAVWRKSHARWPQRKAVAVTTASAFATFFGGWMIADVVWISVKAAKAAGRLTGQRA